MTEVGSVCTQLQHFCGQLKSYATAHMQCIAKSLQPTEDINFELQKVFLCSRQARGQHGSLTQNNTVKCNRC